jgi:DNA mismatch endonuclease, patch repair protein
MSPKSQIGERMSRIRCSDTMIELLLRRELWRRGLRYRKNYSEIVGKPDVAFTKHKIAVFCDSEFWHGYDWENHKHDFRSNKEFWLKKISDNIARDHYVNETLKNRGWTVLRFWGKEIKSNVSSCVDLIEETINERKI